MDKETLRKEFDEFLEKNNAFCMQYSSDNAYDTHWFDEQVLDLFYSKLEEREKAYHLAMQYEKAGWYKDEDYDRLHKENERLTEILKLADDLLEQRGSVSENWRKYQTLKKKQNG